MTTLTNEATRLAASGRASRAPAFNVEFAGDWRSVAGDWDDAYRRGQTTIFQHARWLAAWYEAFADQPGVEPLLITIRDRATGEIAIRLPLIRRRLNGIRAVEFADLELTDYNAPLLGPAAPRDATAAATLWRELLQALQRMPDRADLLRLRKIPVDLDGRTNPLALLKAAGPCSLNGNLVTTGDDFDLYRRSLKRDVRRVLERSWRTFTKYPAATFQVIANSDEALRILATLEAQQSARMQQLGVDFILNGESHAAFYRNLVRDGVASGYAVVSALTVGDEVIATLLGVRSGSRYVMVRFSNAGDKWSSCSPGRLVIERTMAALHKDGVREFDFSIGNYAYKRRFGVAPIPLVDVSAAVSWRGLPYALRDRVARDLRRYPRLTARLKQALGKPPSREEN